MSSVLVSNVVVEITHLPRRYGSSHCSRSVESDSREDLIIEVPAHGRGAHCKDSAVGVENAGHAIHTIADCKNFLLVTSLQALAVGLVHLVDIALGILDVDRVRHIDNERVGVVLSVAIAVLVKRTLVK